jgi:predicted deacylase/putative intracellular protease/amidase
MNLLNTNSPGCPVLRCALLALGLAVAAPSIGVSRSPAAVTTNTLADGTRFATEYYVHDSGVPGPTVMIVGGAHGNEPAGAAAAESIRHWPISKGRIVAVPRANVAGLDANRRLIPGLGSDLRDLNRNYPRAGKNEPARGELADAIWSLALASKPGWLLDLHEGFDFHQLNQKSVGSSIIVFPNEAGTAAANVMLDAVNETITTPELKFVRRDMPIDGSLARAAGEHLRIPAMTLETTSKQDLARRVGQHEAMVRRLFHHLGMLGQPLPALARVETPKTITASTSGSAGVRVALYKGPGTGGAGPPNLMQRLDQPPQSSITQVTPEEIQNGVLASYDVVIFAGGSGSGQAAALGEDGREAVRQFVGAGGGYIGICAGAYLATSGYTWSLNLINARTVSPKWRRGRGTVKVELTSSGCSILGGRAAEVDVLYANGPIVAPADKEDLPEFDTLAFFRTELAENDTPVGIMVDSPAIFASPFKNGRVACISPHPEQTKGLEDYVPRMVEWVAAGKTATAAGH